MSASSHLQRNETFNSLTKSGGREGGLARGAGGKPVRARRGAAAGKGGELAKAAGRMCLFDAFQRYVAYRIGAPAEGIPAQQHAAQFIRDFCGVTSRAQLDHDARAAALFHNHIRRPFQAWMETQHG